MGYKASFQLVYQVTSVKYKSEEPLLPKVLFEKVVTTRDKKNVLFIHDTTCGNELYYMHIDEIVLEYINVSFHSILLQNGKQTDLNFRIQIDKQKPEIVNGVIAIKIGQTFSFLEPVVGVQSEWLVKATSVEELAV